MDISVSDAKAQLTELVRRAEAGEEIVLTRHGHPVAKITAAKPAATAESRRKGIAEIMAAAKGKASEGPSAARSQDYLYDEDGLPV
jgi:prevent-host-death family protein